ncbi:hypothetical protein WN943_018584 [Citrus x changshan-huyou]
MGFNNPDESGSGSGLNSQTPKSRFTQTRQTLAVLPPLLLPSAFRCPASKSKDVLEFARAYLDFKKPEDIMEFAEFFNGHVFVNEKGVQFKTIAELSTLPHNAFQSNAGWSPTRIALWSPPRMLAAVQFGVKFVMENEQRVDLDVSETDESVGVRVGMDMAAENNDTAAGLEPDSTTVEQGGGSGSGRRGRGNTTAGASKKRGTGSEGSSLVQGTNHLINHAKRCPRRSIKNVQQMHLSFSSKADGTTVLSNYSTEPKWDMATVRIFIARMIVMHELPLSFVEYIGFYELLKLLQPSIETISRNTIKAEILKLYDIEKTKAMSVLEACDSRIAVTTDMWTAGNQKKGYMVVTAHYIDNSWVLRSRIMRFIYVPAPHSGEVMCNELYECLMEWNIDRKLSTVTVDNCSANESMIDLLLGKFSASSMIMGGKFLHMRCCAHILNLIVKDGLSVIHKEVEKIRESVHYWTATPSRFEKFEAAKKQLGVKETKNLALDCKTRWNSTYLMLSTALLYKDVFIRLKEC